VLSTPRAQAWSGVTVRKRETFGNLDLWLARLPEFCLLSANQDAVDRGLVSPTWYMATPALVEGRSLAYRAKLRPVEADETMRELGAYAHGPDAVEAADRFVDQIRIWDRDHRRRPSERARDRQPTHPDRDLLAGPATERPRAGAIQTPTETPATGSNLLRSTPSIIADDRAGPTSRRELNMRHPDGQRSTYNAHRYSGHTDTGSGVISRERARTRPHHDRT
jgi:hypothetical protein